MVIPAMQSDATPLSIKVVSVVTTVFVAGAFLIPIITCYVIPDQRARSFYYITLLSVLIISCNVLKLIYHVHRPYWTSDQVEIFSYAKGFGNPSGHAMTVALFCAAGTLDVVSVKRVPFFAKFGVGFFCALIAVITCMTRLFLGVHTLNQLVYGTVLGVWLAFTMYYCVQESLLSHVSIFLSKKS